MDYRAITVKKVCDFVPSYQEAAARLCEVLVNDNARQTLRQLRAALGAPIETEYATDDIRTFNKNNKVLADYLLIDWANKRVYVGKSMNVRSRFSNHCSTDFKTVENQVTDLSCIVLQRFRKQYNQKKVYDAETVYIQAAQALAINMGFTLVNKYKTSKIREL